jgi:TPR repeat protein
MRKFILYFLLVLPFAANAQESNCVALKDAIYALNGDKEKLKPHIENLSKLVSNDDKCAKNLVGRMYSEGYYFPRDSERSYAIFYELSNAGYAPAQYNLAYVLAEKKDVKPEDTAKIKQLLDSRKNTVNISF